ncbi:MAG TPA: FecR domain-containing protein, partial [Caulobacteraceae bacterium]|nr:FecR domain-containing protein [Caulobacteraceae bacterium]
MIGRRFTQPAADDPREAAAEWLMREDDGQLGPEAVAARDAWLAEHPDHVAAYDAARRAMARVEAVAADPRLVAVREAALEARPERRPASWRVAASLAAGVVILAGAGLAFEGARSPSSLAAVLDQITHPGASVYRTDVGQRSTIALSDGSVATLNTDSVVRIAYTGKARAVRLVRGQALFEVAHGQSRPFQVYAGDRVITALGTVFDVRLRGRAVKVALVEGRVKVRAAGAPAPRQGDPAPQVLLAPGEVLEAAPARPMQVANADVARETSWRSGFLVFDQTPLSEAVAELNRYSKDQLVIDDPGIAGYAISGAFKTGDPDRFARTVVEIMPVLLERKTDGELVLSGRPESNSAGG